MILGISGKRGTGKSLLASYLVKNHGWREMPLARELKRRVRADFDLTVDQTDGVLKEIIDPRYGITPRELMIRYGQFFRAIDEMFWVKQVFYHIDRIPEGTNVVIPDVRFKNEARFITSKGGSLVRLERSKDLNVYKTELQDSSETDLDDYSFPLVVPEERNEVPEDLERLAKHIENKEVVL